MQNTSKNTKTVYTFKSHQNTFFKPKIKKHSPKHVNKVNDLCVERIRINDKQ